MIYLVLLASSEFGLQLALNGFAATCDIAGIDISFSKTKVLHLPRNPDQYFLQVGEASLQQMKKLKYLQIAFMIGETQDKELNVKSAK